MLICPGRLMSPPRRAQGGAAPLPRLTDAVAGLTANWEPYYASELAEALVDTTGNGHALTAVGSPTLAAMNATAPAFSLDGSTQYLTCNSLAALLNGDDTPWSAAYLLKRDVAAVYHGHFAAWKNGEASNYRHGFLSFNNDSLYSIRSSTPTAQAPQTAADYLEDTLALLVWNFTGTTLTGYLDGTVITGIAAAAQNTNSMGSNLDRFAWGVFSGAVNHFDGLLAPCCFKVGGVFDGDDRAAIKAFTDTVYGRA